MVAAAKKKNKSRRRRVFVSFPLENGLWFCEHVNWPRKASVAVLERSLSARLALSPAQSLKLRTSLYAQLHQPIEQHDGSGVLDVLLSRLASNIEDDDSDDDDCLECGAKNSMHEGECVSCKKRPLGSGKRRCPKCGKATSNSQQKCVECGAAVRPKGAYVKLMHRAVCLSCRTPSRPYNVELNNYCPLCGSSQKAKFVCDSIEGCFVVEAPEELFGSDVEVTENGLIKASREDVRKVVRIVHLARACVAAGRDVPDARAKKWLEDWERVDPLTADIQQ